MNNSFRPAFPAFAKDPLDDKGINQLQFFAAFAPNEIPTWFEPPINHDNAPKIPKAWDELTGIDEESVDILRRWHHGDLFDKAVRIGLLWYVKEWNEYREAEKQYRKAQSAARFFQWRWYYAQTMFAYQPVSQVVAESQGKVDFTTSSLTQQKFYGKE